VSRHPSPFFTRRGALRALCVIPAWAVASGAEAAEYGSGPGVFAAIEALSQALEARVLALAGAFPPSSAWVASLRADLARHRRERVTLAAARRWPPTRPPDAAAAGDPRSLARLREALNELMLAHAEGLPALGDSDLVQHLAEHMVDLSRHLTIVDLWIEAEGFD